MTDFFLSSADVASVLFAAFVVVGFIWWLCECAVAAMEIEEEMGE